MLPADVWRIKKTHLTGFLASAVVGLLVARLVGGIRGKRSWIERRTRSNRLARNALAVCAHISIRRALAHGTADSCRAQRQ